MSDRIASVGARFILTGRAEFLAGMRQAQEALVATGDSAKASGAAMGSASVQADKLAAANRGVAVSSDASAASSKTQAASADTAAVADGKAGTAAETRGRMTKGAAIGVVAAVGLIGYESVKVATQFQTQMTRLSTAAGMPKAIVDANTQAILDMGTQSGFTGTQVAEALYHPISAGFDMAAAMNIVRDSMKEARISGASLDDTTYSLSSVMKAFNLNANDSTQTMSTLNAIVGQGDMHFQGFNESVKGWAAPAAMFGVSITSVGAALAYMTDRGVPAAQAGTQLGMSMSMMAAPTAKATKILTDAGMSAADAGAAVGSMTDLLTLAGVTTTQMAADMQQPDGLMVALKHLKANMDAGGVSAEMQAATITRAFGGAKSGKAIMEMYNNLGGLQDKYNEIVNSATPSKFDDAWKTAMDTVSGRVSKLKASFINFGIEIGNALLPGVGKAMTGLTKFFDFLTTNKPVMAAFGVVIGVLLVAAFYSLAAAAATAAAGMIAATWPVLAIIAAVAGIAYAFDYAYTHSKTFHDFINTAMRNIKQWVGDAWDWIKRTSAELWPKIKADAEAAFNAIKPAATAVVNWIRDHWSEIKAVAKGVWDVVSTIVVAAVWIISNVVGSVVKYVKDHWPEIKTIAIAIWNDVLKPVIEFGEKVGAKLIEIVAFIKRNWNQIHADAMLAWTIISSTIKFAWDIIYGTIRVALSIIKLGLDVAWTAIKTTVQVVWNIIVTIIKVCWDSIASGIRTAADIIKGFIKIWGDLIHGNWSKLWNDIKDLVIKVWDDIKGGVTKVAGDLWNGLKNIFDDIWGGMKDIALGIWKDVTNIFQSGANAVISVVNGFLSAVNKIAGAVGLTLNLKVDPIGTVDPSTSASRADARAGGFIGPVAMAAGGFVPIGSGFKTTGAQAIVGEGNPAHPEFVIPTDPAYRGRALGLFSALAGQLGSGYMATGGVVPALAGGGVLGDIASAASGALGVVQDVAGAAMKVAQFGLGHALELAWPKLPSSENILGIIPSGVNHVRDQILGFINQQGSQFIANMGGGSGAIPTGIHLQLIDAALAADGIPKDQWPQWEAGMDTLIGRESGWRSGAINMTDSNAAAGHPSQGLTQTIPGTFAAYRNPSLPGGITDPVANIAASINYINANYGGIGGVQQANPSLPAKGYFDGGIVGWEARAAGGPVNAGNPYLVGEQGPELFIPTTGGYVMPAADTAAVTTPGASAIGGLMGSGVHVDAINVYESGNPQHTYTVVKQALADAVARR